MRKKIIFLEVIFFIFLIFNSNRIYAMTSTEMINELYSMGYKYGMTESDKVKLERFVNQYGITDEQIKQIMVKANEALVIFQSRVSVKKLSSEDLNKLKDIAIQSADIVDATVVFTSNRTLDLYKNGIKIDSLRLEDYNSLSEVNSRKLVYTGNDSIKYIAIGIVILSIVLIVFYYIKRKVVYES